MAKRKYVPKVGDEIRFYIDKVKNTGTINWLGCSSLTVFPNSVKVTDTKGKELVMEWTVFFKDIIEKLEVSE